VLLLGAANPGPSRDTEQNLQLRLQRATKPVKKAQYEIRLARLKLTEAIDAFDKRDADKARELLAAYLAHIRSAWQLLQSSGRNAFRHPEGFKELDIALREDGRLLEDLGHHLSYYERSAVDKTAEEIEQIRADVIKALFSPVRARDKGSEDAQP
jgi:hypothetical protein